MSPLDILVSFIIGLAVNQSSDSLGAWAKSGDAKQRQENLHRALTSAHNLEDEVAAACIRVAKDKQRLGIPAHEQKLWCLWSDESCQKDVADWLMAGTSAEGEEVKNRLRNSMITALSEGSADQDHLDYLQTEYFTALDRAFAADPVLAAWRHQLSLDYLRSQVEYLRQRADQAAGIYPEAKRREALDSYCQKALKAWDIVDLSNLPEGDIHIATQKLLLRELYLPLRINVDGYGGSLTRLEEEREARRRWEAGRTTEQTAPLENVPVGTRLGYSRRLVILGDPGGGKTTLLRWMATAYLLRYQNDPAFQQMPDTDTLPDCDWIPVLIRCRDLGEQDLCRSFTDFLAQHLYKTELLPDEAKIMQSVILDGIATGKVLLLVDGLDEITNPAVRVQFCQELELTAARYPDAPLLATSRIVGYRDMPYRMGAAFEHGTIAPLSEEDKDRFAQRWTEVTEQHQPPAERQRRAEELLEALHAHERIKRLTGNPMLLTTLALVKRKVGKLPSRRNKLYGEAVAVLLNWNPRHYTVLDEDEAIPQLEYLAYEMCRRGVQRLPEDEVLDLLDRVRIDYPNIRAMKRRNPEEFLALLETRSSLLIKSGGIWTQGREREKPVWEFRHLTFQEYLAARALLDGRYPGRDKSLSLAQQVAPLAGQVKKTERPFLINYRPFIAEIEGESVILESWIEPLRLLIAACRDDDVDKALLAILRPMDGEDSLKTIRARAVQAVLCLADEPNVSDETADEVLRSFVAQIGGIDAREPLTNRTTVDRAASELAASSWADLLQQCLVGGFIHLPDMEREKPGVLWGMAETAVRGAKESGRTAWCDELAQRLHSDDTLEAVSAALVVMHAAYEGKLVVVPYLIKGLFALLHRDIPSCRAAAWALWWLAAGPVASTSPAYWKPNRDEMDELYKLLMETPNSETKSRCWICFVLSWGGDKRIVPLLKEYCIHREPGWRMLVVAAINRLHDSSTLDILITLLSDDDKCVRLEAIKALANFDDKQARIALEARLHDSNLQVRQETISILVTKRKPAEQKLLSLGLNGGPPWLDPLVPITQTRVFDTAIALSAAERAIRSCPALAPDFALSLESQQR